MSYDKKSPNDTANVSNNSNGNNTPKNQNVEIYSILSNLISNGIVIDKNLRQPSYYSTISFAELKIECFVIIADLLINQFVFLF